MLKNYYIPRSEIFRLCEKLGKGTDTKNGMSIDLKRVKANYIPRIVENADQINILYRFLDMSDLPHIVRTAKGNIKKNNIHNIGGCWDVKRVETERGIFKGVIITVIVCGKTFVFKCGAFTVKNSTMNGTKAFGMAKRIARNYGINIEDYAIDNGEEVKANIPKSKIAFKLEYVTQNPKKTIKHAHHIDLNCAWGTGFVNAFPEFKQTLLDLKAVDKVVPSMFLGYCQSARVKYKYSHFALAGIEWCNKKLDELTHKLEQNNFTVLGYNTDGIWYKDNTEQNRVYHDGDEHSGLYGYKNDYIDTELCIYSDGQYWFKTPDGKFNARARGWYTYEEIKPREEWNEEDFDKAMQTLAYITFIEHKGFIIIGENEL